MNLSLKVDQSHSLTPYRVYITGPHGVGKSTLLKDLKKIGRGKFEFVDEIARPYMISHGITANEMDPLENPAKYLDLQTTFLDLQMKTEKKYEESRKVIFHDRGLDSLVYILHYLPSGYNAVRQIVEENRDVQNYIKRLRSSLLLLVRPQMGFIQEDGVRMLSDFQELTSFLKSFQRLYHLLGLSYIMLESVGREERVREVVAKCSIHH